MTTGIKNRELQKLSLALPSESELFDRFISLLQIYTPEITDLSDVSFTSRLCSLFSAFFTRYSAELLTDIVNEAFNPTAANYEFLAARAIALGYVPKPGNGSTVELSISNRSNLAISISRSSYTYATKRSGESAPVTFEMVPGSVTVPAMSSVTFNAVQGQTVWNEALGSGDGTGLQRFVSQQARAVPGSERVYVAGERWQLAPGNNLLRAGSESKCYERWYDEDGHLKILFGDLGYGRKPSVGEAVVCSYRVIVDGQNGNVPAGSIVMLSPSNSALSVTNLSAAAGWSPPDTMDQIRFQSSRSARVPWEVCVAEEDIPANVERQFPEIGRCYAVPGERGENTIGVHITAADGSIPSQDLMNRVTAFIGLHNPATERVYTSRASYTNVYVSGRIVHDANYVPGDAAKEIVDYYGPLAVDSAGNRAAEPGMIIHPSALIKVLMNVPGVTYVELDSPSSSVAIGASRLPLIIASFTEEEEA